MGVTQNSPVSSPCHAFHVTTVKDSGRASAGAGGEHRLSLLRQHRRTGRQEEKSPPSTKTESEKGRPCNHSSHWPPVSCVSAFLRRAEYQLWTVPATRMSSGATGFP